MTLDLTDEEVATLVRHLRRPLDKGMSDGAY
jgi:hypothetical protein